MEELLPEEPRVLDFCAGTGIAGAATAKATNAPLLTVLDARNEDLKKARKWLEIAGISLELKLITGYVREVSKLVGEHGLALLWGLTMPHFDPFDAVRIFANVTLSLNEDGIFVIKETDRVYGILYNIGYKDFLVESKTEDHTIVSVHEGYNLKRGTSGGHTTSYRASRRLPKMGTGSGTLRRSWPSGAFSSGNGSSSQ
ncbi:class I SAM-dependent methyltransferase [Thermococcus piezophilus]|uniref:class I SAM-dependent methyltransferase n=1 Tax=Thermococcus piezophilus TaxID=1712654 RepID=UPI000ABA02EC|nr:class I SAM-dependent methyltransferase [Thermococcus piezophilus]